LTWPIAADGPGPVVMAIWESRLKAIQQKNNGEPVGWEELLAVLNSPQGWADYNIPGQRTTVTTATPIRWSARRPSQHSSRVLRQRQVQQ